MLIISDSRFFLCIHTKHTFLKKTFHLKFCADKYQNNLEGMILDRCLLSFYANMLILTMDGGYGNREGGRQRVAI